jgi:hypothetical protein
LIVTDFFVRFKLPVLINLKITAWPVVEQDTLMPIRFRCAYCNQLMAIARRKSGTIVRCPRCAGEVIVPPDQVPQPSISPEHLPLLDAEDFDREFAEIRAVPEDLPNPVAPPPAYTHRPLLDLESIAAPAPSVPPARSDAAVPRSVYRPGLFFTLPVLTGIAAAILALIGGVFLFGFFLGRWTVR